ncbi:AsmA family protein [Sphingomonas nostoxanthinifaciens]|uniref:AsmA family protein n=1 Tax=Sphingomonas nostoxanthinifaciens TaxID=2872652 RepID=UPI001CC20060|nr:AsmA family protein [Sphingomonas nostoxanthinifaciens]UAK22849.1 AsmA family protein [Sphingomonas nostoxanthinifaciens]
MRIIVSALVGLLTTIAVALLATAFALDRGLLDGPVERLASRLSGRAIRIGGLHVHLLSRNQWVEIDDLQVANPPGFARGDLARVRRLVATLRPIRFWAGSLGIDTLKLDGVSLSLIRYGPNRNNWTSTAHRQKGPAFAPLAGVRDFQLSNGQLRFHDIARNLDVAGPFAIGSGEAAFRFRGAGMYIGAPVSVGMVGGPLHGEAVGPPYPFAGWLIDGHTRVDVHGRSVQPFDLSAYRLAVRATGPNLADIGYLFHLITPNTAPFRMSAIVTSGSGIMRVGRIDVSSGKSHVTGKIWSNHRDPRREIRAKLHADRLDHADVDAMLATPPSHAQARDGSGAVAAGPPSHYIISDAPLGVARLRATDLDFDISVGVLTGYPLQLRNVTTRLDLDHGLLNMPTFHAALAGGTVVGDGRIDARPAVPETRIAMRFAGLRLAQLPGGAGQTGQVDGQFAIAGAGQSFHAAAAGARGSARLRVSSLSLPKAAGWMIGGDLLRAAASSIGGGKSVTDASITGDGFTGRNGHFASTALTAQSSAGSASGDATVDLGTERFCAYFIGHPAHRRLFQVTAPFRISGPWTKPSVTLLPSPKAKAVGLKGKFGVLLSPVAGLLPIGRPAAPSRGCS